MTQRLLTVVIVLSVVAIVVMKSGTMVIGVVGSGRHHAVDQLSARNLHGAHCVINPTDAKEQFPALSPGHRTLTLLRQLSYNCMHSVTAGV